MNAAALIAEGEGALIAAGIESPRREARLLLAHVLGLEASDLALEGEREVDAEVAGAFRTALARRAAHEPFAYIAGRRAFWSFDLEVTPATLIPRPDTETLVETALKLAGHPAAPLEILDLGTGSGAILIALLAELPNATGFGVDVSEPALAIARRNALRSGVAARARFARSSWWSHVSGSFDLVVSNPPYIPTAEIAALDADVRDHEPRLALDGGPDGLAAYRAIASVAVSRLSPGGALIVEVGQGQAEDVARMFMASGFAATEIAADLAGIPRVVAGLTFAEPLG
ncbi:Release factor glutamine methyltransferase [Alphaproteobacteria bacterium SO-S41]|nr:Release factor glutamine methyltransferase [Alphaproteobacteria bacterium SO-S41]